MCTHTLKLTLCNEYTIDSVTVSHSQLLHVLVTWQCFSFLFNSHLSSEGKQFTSSFVFAEKKIKFPDIADLKEESLKSVIWLSTIEYVDKKTHMM